MDVRFLILALFFLVSCMPETQVGSSNISSSTTAGSTTGSTPPGANRPVKWNYLNSEELTITLSVQNLQAAYVGGTQVETYLSNSTNYVNADYCLVTRYNIAGESKELRSRTIPFQTTDFNLQRVVKSFRVDFHDQVNSEDTCNKAIPLRVQSSTSQDYVPDPGVVPYNSRFNHPDQVCNGCVGVLKSSSVSIYKRTRVGGIDYLDKIPVTLIDTQKLELQINPHADPGGGSGTCSTNSCRATGYDCCLDNQCVKDGYPRPGMQGTPLYQSIEEQRITNPLAYINYPHVYYVCGTSTTGGSTGGGTTGSTTAGSTGGSTTGGTTPELTRRQKDYSCMEHIKGQTTTTPYHNELLGTSFTSAPNCITGMSASEKALEDHYLNAYKRMYEFCGCGQSKIEDMIYNCPNYEFKVTSWENINGEQRPRNFECTVVQPPGPIPTERTVQVNSRSAPHRFFNTSGVESKTPTGEQEGPAFTYLDPDDKLTPVQAPLSMNAILGQMSVGLTDAHPAKMVDVELDRVYFLTTTRGTYSPCPECAKDSWINTFSAYPTTIDGVGLQSVGFTTKRDQIGTNITQGNYEDTIFGRACWVPPTMLPFSHTPTNDRLARLQTQATLFTNGYQRDWFGFNKGALIGSFDGVTWFAIGKGRIVRSTSTKLFLAINAPFADLANPSIHEVFVQNFNNITQATTLDYDPQYHATHNLQNEAGNCQRHHMCETDKDCITSLGWEYACADVRDLKTYLPSFNTDGKEISSAGNLPVTIEQILQQKTLSGSTKRCVYRGAGSICSRANMAGVDLNKKKLLTCAPNFFCAPFSSPYHNTEINRFAGNLEDIPLPYGSIYGQMAHILGRPMDYIGTKSIPGAETAISANIKAIDSTLGTLSGLCQPGKALPSTTATIYTNPFEQARNADNFNSTRRADSINQIATCNASYFDNNRHTSCPVLNDDGNYAMFAAQTLPTDFAKMASSQNACGLESLDNVSLGSNLDNANPFRLIEAKSSKTLPIVERSLMQNACLRRAGSVCHTDLDCSPNSLHEEATGMFALSFFGNMAERDYYAESLICGQKDPEPYLSDSEAQKKYKMNMNVCCREIGKDLTTYTADVPNKINVTSNADYVAATQGLKMGLTPGVMPNDPKRYSRLAVIKPTTPAKPLLSAAQMRSTVDPFILSGTLNVTTSGQWQTLSEVNSKTCCGGGWIRKFSDGSTDWKVKNRFHIDVTNFVCINSRTPLLSNPEALASRYTNDYDVRTLVSRDHEKYCEVTDASTGGCAYYGINDEVKDILPTTTPLTVFNNVTVNTLKPDFTGANHDFYFTPLSGDTDSRTYADFTTGVENARKNISIIIPSYVSRKDFDDSIPTIQAVRGDGATQTCSAGTFTLADPTSTIVTASICLYDYNSATRVLRVAFKDPASGEFHHNKQVGVQFTVATAPKNTALYNKRTLPGSSMYYLKRLGRLELSGIPQITFEEMYCNDNMDSLVPGVFKGMSTKTDIQNPTKAFKQSYMDGNGVLQQKHFTNMHALENPPVFSSHEFKCCSPLGTKVSNETQCCSGFGVSTDQNSYTCSLPSGTNLSVYFNKFVSNEGRSLAPADGRLMDEDFEAQTGEPKVNSTVSTKIRSLGTTYCESKKVRQGGAFGQFPVVTNSTSGPKLYNIVDSPYDIGQSSNAGATYETGYRAFMNGFRWNHHLYCD